MAGADGEWFVAVGGETPQIWRHPFVGNLLDTLPAQRATGLRAFIQNGKSLLFLTVADGTMLRSEDGGEQWRPLYLNTVSAYNKWIASAADGTLYYTSNGSDGGDGVLHSIDSGLLWQRMNEGLTDLRGVEPIQTVDPDRLYQVTAAHTLVRWQAEEGRWQPVALPDASI